VRGHDAAAQSHDVPFDELSFVSITFT